MHLPKVILFDAAGTLFHLPKGVGFHYAEVMARHGLNVDAQAVEQAFRVAWKKAAAPRETPGPRPDDDKVWWRTVVDAVWDMVEARGVDRDAVFAELWEEFAQPDVWELYPESRDVLATLGNRFRLGVLSNFDSRLHRILDQLGIAHFFEHVVVSSEVGADKPSPRIFAAALDRFDALPENVLHVGDDPQADWQGAEAAGLRVFRLRRPENSLRDLLAAPEL